MLKHGVKNRDRRSVTRVLNMHSPVVVDFMQSALSATRPHVVIKNIIDAITEEESNKIPPTSTI